MTISPTSTIALVTCDENSKVNFAHVVGEMRRSLEKPTNSSFTLTWDHDDIAAFDFESTRIVVSLADQTMSEIGSDTDYLFISVGAPPSGHRHRDPAVVHEQLCSMIVERVCAYYKTKSVFWQQINECVTSETVDHTFDRLIAARSKPALSVIEGEATYIEPVQPPQPSIVQIPSFVSRPSYTPPSRKARGKIPAVQALLPTRVTNNLAANDLPAGVNHDIDRLCAIRSALYEVQDMPVSDKAEKSSPIIRITATALDTTMVIVCLPVGAAMLTYHVFRGGELRRTAHMMTITGLLMASSKAVAAMQITHFF